jgi:tetratricopeptide (TPR) repeat protein
VLFRSPSHYQQLVDLLEEHAGDCSRAEAQAMYTFAQNYCIKKINRGESAFLGELFRLYRQLLDQGILIESDGYLAHWYYKNITTVGLRLGDYEWVKDFLETYRQKIHPADRDNAYNYNLSAYYYEQRRYHEAMKLLQQVEFTEVNYHLSAKALLLKIYYELEEDEALKYLIQSYQVYLKRNQDLAVAHIEGHKNLLRFVKKAYRLRRRKPQLDEEAFSSRHAALTEQVNTTPGIPNANWLRTIVQEIADPGPRAVG